MSARSYRIAPRWRALTPQWQDTLIAVGHFVVGIALYQSHIYPLFSGVDSDLLSIRWTLLAVICVLLAFRRRAPVLCCVLATGITVVDVSIGISAPIMIVFSDHIFAATLYGPRRLSRAMVPIAAVGTLAVAAAALAFLGDWRIAILATLVTIPFLITPVWWAISVRQFQEFARTEQEKATALERISELDRKAAVADERGRMARDLHDVIAGHLSAIAIQSEAALSANPTDPVTTRKILTTVREDSLHALSEMRAMIGLLRSASDEQEIAAPARLADLFRLVESARSSGLRIEVHADLDEPLPAAVDLTAYRIAQESLTNAVKHAPGAAAKLEITRAEDILIIKVTNDLPNATERSNDGGMGLLNMTERATAIGGSLSAGPSEAGWQVRATLPMRVASP